MTPNSQILSIHQYPRNDKVQTVDVKGSKNCALPIIMYCYLYYGDNPIVINNIPNTADVRHVLKMLSQMGGIYEYDKTTHVLAIKNGITTKNIPKEMLGKTRISVLMMSIMLIIYGEVFFPKKVGGCNLGNRNYDYHLQAFESMGCVVDEQVDAYHIVHKNYTHNTLVSFPKETTTGTENALFFAAHATKHTRIQKCHLRPEIRELILFMNQLGANIVIEGEEVVVHGATKPEAYDGFSFTIIDDMEEALSYITLGYATDSSYDIIFNNPYYYRELELLTMLGRGNFIRDYQVLHQRPFSTQYQQKHISITTHPYPFIGSDSQPILAVLLLLFANSFSITETRFNERFAYTQYFDIFGIDYELKNNILTVNSKTYTEITDDTLYEIKAHDLRAGMHAVLLAAMLKKKIQLKNAHYLLRGYTDLYTSLKKLGFNITLS